MAVAPIALRDYDNIHPVEAGGCAFGASFTADVAEVHIPAAPHALSESDIMHSACRTMSRQTACALALSANAPTRMSSSTQKTQCMSVGIADLELGEVLEEELDLAD
eukprot:117263-Rhodomonas_salina.1